MIGKVLFRQGLGAIIVCGSLLFGFVASAATVTSRADDPTPPLIAAVATKNATTVPAPLLGQAITRFFYLHPTDRPFRNDYYEALGNAALTLQAWFRSQLGGSISFTLPQPVVIDIALAHPAEWYVAHDPGSSSMYGGDPRMQFWTNVLTEVFPKTGGAFFDKLNAWVYYIDADSGCGQLGGAGGNSVTILTGNDLRGLIGKPYYDCHGVVDPGLTFPPSRWIGGQAHELGHAFGLPHPPGCDAGAAECDYDAVMWAGFYYGFPDHTYLRDDDKLNLRGGSFVQAPTLPLVNIDQEGIGGSWANAATDSQGFVIDLLPDLYHAGAGLLFGGWFTFDVSASGGVRWYTLQGTVAPDTTAAMLPIYLTKGGAFDSAQATETDMVGVATIRFADCTHASLAYLFSDGSGRRGVIPLQRLLQNVVCTNTGEDDSTGRHQLAGVWADMHNSGQGLVLDIDPAQSVFFAAWYTFESSGRSGAGAEGQRWYTLQATLIPEFRSIEDIGIYETGNGIFDHAAGTSTVQVGKATIVFHDCLSATLSYRFTSGAQSGAVGSLELHRFGAEPIGCAL